MSNGIADAIDADGQLFGFERVLELVRSANSVADVVAEAQRFGQDDPEELRWGREVGGRAAAADPTTYGIEPAKSLDQMLYKRASAGRGFYKTTDGKFGLTELPRGVAIDDVPLPSAALV